MHSFSSPAEIKRNDGTDELSCRSKSFSVRNTWPEKERRLLENGKATALWAHIGCITELGQVTCTYVIVQARRNASEFGRKCCSLKARYSLLFRFNFHCVSLPSSIYTDGCKILVSRIMNFFHFYFTLANKLRWSIF